MASEVGIEFERLQINNFASYFGEHSIDLSTEAGRPVVIIMGGNGFGKSSLFHALNWALYGTQYERDLAQAHERSIVDYIHENEVAEAIAAGRNAEMSVTAHFRIQSEKYYVSQYVSVPVRAASDSSATPLFGDPDRSTRSVRIERSGNHKELEYDGVLDQALPNNVRDYFLFDGDRIHQLSQPGSSQEVSDALRRVVDLDLLSEAEQDVREVARLFAREANALASGELKSVGEEMTKARETLAREKDMQEGLRGEERLMRDKLEGIEQQLAETAASKPLQEKRRSIQVRLQDLEKERSTTYQRMREQLSKAFLSISAPAVVTLSQELNKRREAGDLPAKISKTLLTELLENEMCLCGTKLQDGSDATKEIRARLERLEHKKNMEELLPLFYALSGLSDDISDAHEKLGIERDQLDEQYGKFSELDVALKHVEEELSHMPDKDVATLERTRKKVVDDMHDNRSKQGANKQRIEDAEDRISSLREQQERLEKDQESSRKIYLRERLADAAADALHGIYERFAEDSRAAVEELTSKRFRDFVKSSSEYSVTLSDDYSLTVLDSSGAPALQRLSMGQRQCLSLAFITSVSDVSGKHPPLAIDMPFGRLDGEVDQNVASELSKITHQLILFLLPDREWTPGIQNALRDKVSHLHSLDFDPATRSTTISDQGEF